MLNMTYKNHLGETVVFNEVGIVTDASDLFSRKWGYSAAYNKILGFYQSITVSKIEIALVENSKSKANELFGIFEKDVRAQKEGVLTVGEYSINGFFYVSKPKVYNERADYIRLELEFITDRKNWIKSTFFVFNPEDNETEEGRGYSYDYPYDFASSISTEEINNPSFMDSAFRMTIFGEVNDPKVYIGDHLYEVNVELSEGEYLVIDSLNKRVYTVNETGEQTNVFASRNASSYIFQPIPAGYNTMSVTPDCIVSLELLEERSEPEWI